MSQIIAAIATGTAPCAIGIIRLSGPGCLDACRQVFRPKGGGTLSQRPWRTMVYGDMLDAHGAVVDHGLAVAFPPGGSYTGEESCELHCHGSPVVLREVLGALFAAGARQAEPGEFTRRAFLSGRLDLSQAEAVIDLIDAQTAAQARSAAACLEGGLRRRLQPVQQSLTDVAARFYAVVDYPDEDIEAPTAPQLTAALTAARDTLADLLAASRRDRWLRQGAFTVLLGPPNAGKSSLLNALAGYDRAIVTPHPGTTRDTVEQQLLCGAVPLRLVDTAGIRQTPDPLEQLGAQRARQAAGEADLAIAVADGALCPPALDPEIAALAAAAPRWILALSKSDLSPALSPEAISLPPGLPPPAARVSFSSVVPGGLSALTEAVEALFPVPSAGEAAAFLSGARQESVLAEALSAVERALAAMAEGMTPDAVLSDAEAALSALGRLTGRTAGEEILETVFSRFCVGK